MKRRQHVIEQSGKNVLRGTLCCLPFYRYSFIVIEASYLDQRFVNFKVKSRETSAGRKVCVAGEEKELSASEWGSIVQILYCMARLEIFLVLSCSGISG